MPCFLWPSVIGHVAFIDVGQVDQGFDRHKNVRDGDCMFVVSLQTMLVQRHLSFAQQTRLHMFDNFAATIIIFDVECLGKTEIG